VKLFMVKAWEKDLSMMALSGGWTLVRLSKPFWISVRSTQSERLRVTRSGGNGQWRFWRIRGCRWWRFPQSPQRMIKACARFYDAVAEKNLGA
jgi:hypothetical protein